MHYQQQKPRPQSWRVGPGDGPGIVPGVESLRECRLHPWQNFYAAATSDRIGVDETAQILRGIVVAQVGEFKTDGRGAFDEDSLRSIVALINAEPLGIRSHFTHGPEQQTHVERLGSYLGRVRSARLDSTTNREGRIVRCVRADFYFDASASISPQGNLAAYVAALAKSGPDAISSSLVLRSEYVTRRIGPPVWRPVEIKALDIVGEGDAVDALLSVGG